MSDDGEGVLPRSDLTIAMPPGAMAPRTADIVSLSDRRAPVLYTVRIMQRWDDSLSVFVEDVSDDQRSRASIVDALRRAADMIAEG